MVEQLVAELAREVSMTAAASRRVHLLNQMSEVVERLMRVHERPQQAVRRNARVILAEGEKEGRMALQLVK